MSDVEDPIDLADEGGDDLFGDGDLDDDLQSEAGNERVVSEKDLASDQEGDEQSGQEDADVDMDAQPEQTQNRLIMTTPMYRHRTPRSKDGTLQSLKVPSFLRVAAETYNPDTFEVTQDELDNAKSDNPKVKIRHQRDASTGKMKSNAVVYRWSDGSMTLSVGSEHYEITKKQMAPAPDKPYQERQDAHYYGASALVSSNLFLTVGHVTEQYTVQPNRNMQDDALAVFASRMAEVARGKAQGADKIFTATKDPELQRKEAEMAEKERMKAQRRRENAAARLETRAGGYRSAGLSIGDLEGGRRPGASGRKRGQPGASRAKKRRPEYDSDDDLPAGRGRGDEYDREDDFIAPSDEEGASEIEEDEEDLLDDDEEEEAPRRKRQRTVEDDDADADADPDDVGAAPAADRSRRRQIVDDDSE
ncbi:RNA polymerase-associated LEO1 [Apiospora phragmitis]|uniref:RNA polymerase-associated LEO1 n=1 Tax=Apiospora phragmitis TaxID=2905665 RepID=A0ABR1TPN3_9PEZI